MDSKQPIVIDSDEEMSEQKQHSAKESNENSPKQKEELFGFIKFQKQFAKRNINVEDIKPEHITPWFKGKTVQIKDSLLRFHNEIIDFYNFVSPSKQTHQSRLNAFKNIKDFIQSVLPEVKVFVFGSFATQLYLPDADIDVGIITNQVLTTSEAYTILNRRLEKQPQKYTELQYIRKSKVPLIKFVCGESGIQFDISIDKNDGLNQIEYVEKMKNHYPEFKYLVFVFKCMLKIRNLGETYTGGIGSFLLFCMILFYLYEVHRDKKYYTLSEHVIKFMQFYGENDWGSKVIYMKEGMIGDRHGFQNHVFSMFSPQDESHDIGKAAFKIKDTLNLFRNRARYLMGKNFMPRQSILKSLVNPNKDIFKYYD